MRAEPDVIYLSPRGRRCVLVPHRGGSGAWLDFRYLDNPSLAGGGFPLTHSNFRLMRLAPPPSLPSTGVRVTH